MQLMTRRIYLDQEIPPLTLKLKSPNKIFESLMNEPFDLSKSQFH
jgi:hypothetical protein